VQLPESLLKLKSRNVNMKRVILFFVCFYFLSAFNSSKINVDSESPLADFSTDDFVVGQKDSSLIVTGGLFDGLENGGFGRKIIQSDLTATQAAVKSSGIVVTKICINRAGVVTYVELIGSESSVTDRNTLKAFLKASRSYKFQQDLFAPKEQCTKLQFTIVNSVNNNIR